MANQPVQHTITQRTTVVEEEYGPPVGAVSPFNTPKPQGRPKSARRRLDFQSQPEDPDLITFSPDNLMTFSPDRPAPTAADEALVGEVARILNDFQSRCDEVMANLASLPRPPGGGSPGYSGGGSPGSPESPGSYFPEPNAYTNIVKPTIEDMLHLIQFGMTDFVEERIRHSNNLHQVLDKNLKSLVDLQNKLEEFDTVIENGSQFIPDFIVTWGNMAQYFRQHLEECENPDNPLPNLNAVNHPSPEITQDAYRDLLWQIVVMCQQAERDVRLGELMYSSLDETTENIRTRLEQTFNNLRYFEELRENMHLNNHGLLRDFGEKQRQVNHFLSEWQKGGDQLNQPPPQRSPMPPIPNLSPKAGVPSGRTQQRGFATPSPGGRSATPSSSPDTPIEEQEERVRRLRGKAQQLEEIIIRYNELQGTILHEVQSIRDQNEVLEQSMVAMQDIPQNSDTQ